MREMLDDLAAVERHSRLPAELDIFGRLIGSWDVENRDYDEASGEWITTARGWHFGRILDGLGVQDVLRDEAGVGTTVRVFDPRAGVWRVGWYGPVGGNFVTLVGRPDGDGILQEGSGLDGRPIRWTFHDITSDSFHWQGSISDDEGATWRMEQEMWARRR